MWLGGIFKYRTVWTQPFSVWFLDHHLNTGPFDNQTQIYLLNTCLVQYSNGFCSSNAMPMASEKRTSEYSGDLKFGIVWILNSWKEVALQMIWISNGIWNLEAQSFEIWTNGSHFVKNHLKSGQKMSRFVMARFSNGWDHSYGYGLGTGPYEIRSSKSLDFKCFRISKWSDFRSPL